MSTEAAGPNKPIAVTIDSAELSQILRDYPDLLENASKADALEHELTFTKAFHKYWKAAAWSMFLSMALIMEGYDMGSLGSFFGQPVFVDRFGTEINGVKAISAPWQTGLNNGALCGEIIGLALNGFLQEWFGYKRTMIGALAFMGATIFIPVFCQSLPVLCLGFVLEGIPWGIFQTLTTSYAAEICPLVLRPYLASFVNLCWGVGFLINSGIIRGTLDLPGNWSWRVPFMLQWFWVIVLPIGVFFAPESPWWLVRKGRFDDAKHCMSRLVPEDQYSEQFGDEQVALMRYTTLLEKAEIAGASWADCFRGTNLRRTEIACMVWAIQWLCGDNIIAYAIQFFEKAGLGTDPAFDLNIGLNCMYTVGTLISWFLMRAMGLRTLYMFGLVLMTVILLVLGVLGFFQDRDGVAWGIGAIMILVNLAYNVSIGPGCYSIVSIVPAGRVRGKTIVLARTTYNLVGLVMNTLTPRMIASDEWNWGARGCLFYMGTAIIAIIWCYFRLPELKHRSFAEIDILFANKTSARQFKHASVDQFGTDHLDWNADKKDAGGKGEHAEIEHDEGLRQNL